MTTSAVQTAAGQSKLLAIPPKTFEQRGRFLPEQTTAVSILDRLLHQATVVIPDGDSYRGQRFLIRQEVGRPHSLQARRTENLWISHTRMTYLIAARF